MMSEARYSPEKDQVSRKSLTWTEYTAQRRFFAFGCLRSFGGLP